MEFRCATCGRAHEALPPEEAPEQDPAKLDELRAAWSKAYAKADAAHGEPPKERDRLWTHAERLGMIYLTAMRYTGVPRIPDTLVSVKGPEGFALKCAEHEESAT